MHICCEESYVLWSRTIARWTNHRFSTIKNMSPMSILNKLKLFLGILNFCHHFIKDVLTITAPLPYFTKKYIPFQWTKQQQVFNTLRQALYHSEKLAFYNPNACLTVDASPQGLGAILLQFKPGGTYCLLLQGSRSLRSNETKYSQKRSFNCTLGLQTLPLLHLRSKLYNPNCSKHSKMVT